MAFPGLQPDRDFVCSVSSQLARQGNAMRFLGIFRTSHIRARIIRRVIN